MRGFGRANSSQSCESLWFGLSISLQQAYIMPALDWIADQYNSQVVQWIKYLHKFLAHLNSFYYVICCVGKVLNSGSSISRLMQINITDHAHADVASLIWLALASGLSEILTVCVGCCKHTTYILQAELLPLTEDQNTDSKRFMKGLTSFFICIDCVEEPLR